MDDMPSTQSETLSAAIRGNLDHPSGVWCQGCRMELDVDGILEDLREAGWELLPIGTAEMPGEDAA
jgi:hypothetical protein